MIGAEDFQPGMQCSRQLPKEYEWFDKRATRESLLQHRLRRGVVEQLSDNTIASTGQRVK